MKQTAVEWYEKEINSLFEKYESKQISRADFLIMKHNLFYPAKEMEKEQIMKTARQCHFEGVRQSVKTSEDYINYGEEYYKENYEQK